MRVLLVARDVAPSQALERLREVLLLRLDDVHSFLGYGKPISNSYNSRLITERPCVVLCGMSSFAEVAKDEIAVAEVAARMGMPYGFYADTYGSAQRPHFEHLRKEASFIFVINGEEAKTARELYPNAKVVVSGNPMWEDFFIPKLSREEVRSKFEVDNDEYMVLCPGGKSLTIDTLHWGAVIEALSMEPTAEKWKVFFSAHPGSQYLPEDYTELINYSKRVSVRLVAKDFMSASDMLPGVDIVINSASTIGIEAACQRKPVIEYFTEIALARLEESIHSRNWPTWELGVAAKVNGNPERLLCKIRDLLFYGGFVSMRKRQEEVYPAPQEKGSAVRKMVETLMMIKRR